MASLAYVTGIIARRLQHSRAAAAALAGVLSEDDRDLVELSAREPGCTVQIAALIYGARLRAARRIADAQKRAAAIAAANQEAAEHNRIIAAEPLPRSHADAGACRQPRDGFGLRVVLTPPDMLAEDPELPEMLAEAPAPPEMRVEDPADENL